MLAYTAVHMALDSSLARGAAHTMQSYHSTSFAYGHAASSHTSLDMQQPHYWRFASLSLSFANAATAPNWLKSMMSQMRNGNYIVC